MSGLQSTPRQSRVLPTKGQALQSNYSPRTLENTRTRFAGLFTAFGVGGDPSTSSSSSRPPTGRKASLGGPDVDDEHSTAWAGVLPPRPPIPEFRAPPILSPSTESDALATSQSITQHRMPAEASSSAHFSTFWSFLSPTTSPRATRLSPASSVKQRMRTKAMTGKGKGKEGESEDVEWDGGVDVSEPTEQLPLPDELYVSRVHVEERC